MLWRVMKYIKKFHAKHIDNFVKHCETFIYSFFTKISCETSVKHIVMFHVKHICLQKSENLVIYARK